MESPTELPAHLPNRHGVAIVYTIVAILVVIGFTSLAVDVGRVQLAKAEIEAATDAATRHGARGLAGGPLAVKALVAAAAAENKVNGTPLVIDTELDIEFGMWDPATRKFTVVTGAAQSTATAVRVTGRRTASRGTGIPLVFASLLGFDTCDVKSSCVVFSSGLSSDVFLIQDITTSFKEELADAKVGDLALLNNLYSGGGDGRFGIAVHTGWGKTLVPLTPILSNYSFLSSKISSIQLAGTPGMPVTSGTDIASGFDEAIAAYTAAGYTPPAGMKTVVLVSDGQPTANSGGKHPTLSDTQLLQLAQTRADTLWSNQVHIYIVFMDADNDTTAANRLKTLIRGNGDFVRVSNPDLLLAALSDITNKIRKFSVVQ